MWIASQPQPFHDSKDVCRALTWHSVLEVQGPLSAFKWRCSVPWKAGRFENVPWIETRQITHRIPKTNSSALKIGLPPQKGKDRFPNINFQGQAVSFREGTFTIDIDF